MASLSRYYYHNSKKKKMGQGEIGIELLPSLQGVKISGLIGALWQNCAMIERRRKSVLARRWSRWR